MRVDLSGIEFDTADPEGAAKKRELARRTAGRTGHPGAAFNRKELTDTSWSDEMERRFLEMPMCPPRTEAEKLQAFIKNKAWYTNP